MSRGPTFLNGGIDVVLVHLFHSTGGDHWFVSPIKDQLLRDVPYGRFIEWNYDSGLVEPPNVKTSSRLALILLGDLARHREDRPSGLNASMHGSHGRPIVFVAHSFGRFVAKSARKIASEDNNWSHIAKDLKGCIFLATPHSGVWKESIGNIVQTIASTFWQASSIWRDTMSIGSHCRKWLQRTDEKEFDSLQGYFNEFVDVEELRVLNLRETRTTLDKVVSQNGEGPGRWRSLSL